MRSLLLIITLPLLTAATWLAWQHRFQVDPAHPTVDLADLVAATPPAAGVAWENTPSGQPVLALKVGTPAHPVVQRLPLPGLPPAEFLLFDFKAQAQDLTPGPMPWADGRLLIEWHPEGRQMEPEYLGSARENYATEISCLVASSDLGPALPVLRMEHLGISGRFLLERCRITVVHETDWWRYGRWLLLAGWFGWAAGVARTSGYGPMPLRIGVPACWRWGAHAPSRVAERALAGRRAPRPFRDAPPGSEPAPWLPAGFRRGRRKQHAKARVLPIPRAARLHLPLGSSAQSLKALGLGRPLLAAAIWLICATQWAVPGPWEALRPMAANFARTPAPTAPAPIAPAVQAPPPATVAPPAAPPAAEPAAAESLGELEFSGSLLLMIKDKIKRARPLFHVLLFFFPALVFAGLAGRWRCVVLTAALAAGIEGAQYLFGYGFDRTDVLDLLQDAAGIGLALIAHHRLTGWLRKRRQGLPVTHNSSDPASMS